MKIFGFLVEQTFPKAKACHLPDQGTRNDKVLISKTDCRIRITNKQKKSKLACGQKEKRKAKILSKPLLFILFHRNLFRRIIE